MELNEVDEEEDAFCCEVVLLDAGGGRRDAYGLALGGESSSMGMTFELFCTAATGGGGLCCCCLRGCCGRC